MIEKSRHLRVGSMFTGYGGLDMAVLAHFGGTLAWYAEVEPAACKVLAAHHPGVPNLGDVTVVDWTEVEPVDAITAGYPCQPFSHAGKRKGKNDERHLWPYVRDAIGALGPSHVVLENVAGHLSMGLADVIGDLAGLGYDARWGVVRASDAGAPHQRARVFIVAYPNRAGWQQHGGTVADESEHSAAERAGHNAAKPGGRSLARTGAARVGLPEPAERRTEPAADSDQQRLQHASDRVGCSAGSDAVAGHCNSAADSGGQRHGSGQGPAGMGRVDRAHEGSARERQRPRQEPGAGGVADAADTSGDEGRISNGDREPAADAIGREHGKKPKLASSSGSRRGNFVTAWDADSSNVASQSSGNQQESIPSRDRSDGGSGSIDWGQYEPAIRRWERLTRPVPAPTVQHNGRHRLSPAFVEWMMGLAEGHVTGHGLSNAQALKMLGNGVVPQQARLALGLLA